MNREQKDQILKILREERVILLEKCQSTDAALAGIAGGLIDEFATLIINDELEGVGPQITKKKKIVKRKPDNGNGKELVHA